MSKAKHLSAYEQGYDTGYKEGSKLTRSGGKVTPEGRLSINSETVAAAGFQPGLLVRAHAVAGVIVITPDPL